MNIRAIILMSLLSFYLPFRGYSQQGNSKIDKSNEISNVEKFSLKSGVLIQKEFVDIGSVKGCKIQIANFTDLISGEKTNGVKFEYEASSSYTSDTKLALLDSDELDGLIKSITIIQEKILPNLPENYTEVSYKSRGGFEAGCYKSRKDWSAYLKLEKYDGKSYVFMNKEDLGQLMSLLRSAKEKL